MDAYDYTSENADNMCAYTDKSESNINQMYKYELASAEKIADAPLRGAKTSFEDILETQVIAAGSTLINIAGVGRGAELYRDSGERG